MNDLYVWTVIGGLALMTYINRFSFLGIFAGRDVPPAVRRALAYVPSAVLPAIIAAEVFGDADMIVKVKEPQAAERAMLREGQVLFTYLHLAPDPEQARDLMVRRHLHRLRDRDRRAGGLPLLAPMSEVAGRLAPQAGALGAAEGERRRGVLLGGVPGVKPGQGRRHRRRRRRHPCGPHGRRHGRRCHRARPLAAAPARPRRHVRRPFAPALRHPRDRSRTGAARRPGDRRGAGARRRGAEARHPRRC
jgi:uncharacterized membrane protein